MESTKNELLDVFEKLNTENKNDVLAYIRVAYNAQEATKKQYAQQSDDRKPAA
jgi:hypothetical protein